MYLIVGAGIYSFHARTNSIVRDNYINFYQYGIYERFNQPGIVPNIHDNTLTRATNYNESESAVIKLQEIRSAGGVMSNNVMNIDIYCYGILLDNCIGQLATDNHIFYSISQFAAGNIPGNGIFIRAQSNNYILGNEINCNNPPERISAGISIGASIGNTICCNSVTNGVKCYQFSGGCDGSVWRGNGSIGTYTDELLLNRSSFFGPQPNNGNNPFPISSYNYWNPQSGGRLGDARNLNGIGNFTRRSQITAKGCILTEWPTIIVPTQNCSSNPLNWLISIPQNNATQDCGSISECQVPIVGFRGDPEDYLSDNDIAIATGELYQVEIGNILEWEGMKHLILIIRLHPNLLGLYSSIDSFYYASLGTNLLKFHLIDSLLFRASRVSSEENTENDSLLIQLTNYSNSISLLLDSLSSASNSQDSLLILQAINVQSLNFDSVRIILDQKYADHNNLISMMRNSAQAILYTITPSNLLESNEKLVRQLHIDLVLSLIDTATAQQLTQLSELSSLCPYKEGNLVFWARDLYNIFNPQAFYDDDLICIPSQNMTLKNADEKLMNEIINIKANPIQAVIELRISKSSYDKLNVKIYSLDGKLIFKSGILNSDQLTIPCESWTSGIYQIALYSENKFLAMKSISVIK
ncbi:MAG: hypothetical protein HOP11_15725 [Saprospiraceae bacterium]|nr:hypothetical protein [Saprospiraceae bacterium]